MVAGIPILFKIFIKPIRVGLSNILRTVTCDSFIKTVNTMKKDAEEGSDGMSIVIGSSDEESGSIRMSRSITVIVAPI